jgi:hypothetical protein
MTTVAHPPNLLSAESFLAERKEYEEFVASVGDDAWDEISGEKRPNKRFFRQLAKRFGVDVEILKEEIEYVPCNPDVCPKLCAGTHYENRFTVKATRRENNAKMDGDGSCIDNEKWPLRTKTATKKQVKAIEEALNAYAPTEQIRALEQVSMGRVGDPRFLTPGEASALLDFLYGNSPVLEPVVPTRNSRHNVRATARTRAGNRAISDLIAGGVVSAEEFKTEESHASAASQPAKAETPRAPQKSASKPAIPHAQPTKEISPLQKKRIEKHPQVARMSETQLGQFLSNVTSGGACRIERLNSHQASQVITALDNMQEKSA